ncbi:DUF1611 domain-containing protein [Pontimonas sp.]|uniref:DUF1611 domain-containing protein n=1 Tax=Pontimonas sp. TaxID=2304492 RepID=UPI00286FE615|nr:DUF1611 domain-containing protein [Pontimonas sp.]MDR9396010.1 DUF1611 domain-containing protein [Pontimonas sp.]
MLTLRTPYLVFLGDEADAGYAKTGVGLAYWRPDLCVGQMRLSDNAADAGLPDQSIQEAKAAGAQSVVLGVAMVGGAIPAEWLPILVEALEAGMDVVAGFHTRLSSFPELVDAAERGGANLVDVRVPPADIPVGTGQKRTGRRLLTVGTDCALGKKYTALALAKGMAASGMSADFRATGQTGILIAGGGVPLDAVVADFLVGAAEKVSPDNDPDHWDVIEGQGALFHPGYGPVSMGLLIGSQPDAFVVCTEAGRDTIRGWDRFSTPDIRDVIARTIDIGQQFNPDIRCVGISANTRHLDASARADYLGALEKEYGLPAIDPIATGVEPIVTRLATEFGQ